MLYKRSNQATQEKTVYIFQLQKVRMSGRIGFSFSGLCGHYGAKQMSMELNRRRTDLPFLICRNDGMKWRIYLLCYLQYLQENLPTDLRMKEPRY